MEKYMTTHTLTTIIKIHPDVFAQVDDEWRKTFYKLNTKEEIINHIAYNLLRERSLSQLDGFANLPDEYARLEYLNFEIEDCDKFD